MSDPIVEQIAQWLKTAIDTITTANGYNYDLSGHRPYHWDETTDQLGEYVIQIVQDDPKTEDVMSKNYRTWEQEFLLSFVVYDTESEPIDAKINKIRSDIEKKLGIELTSKSGGTCCGGLATHILFKPPQYFVTERGIGLIIPIAIRYSVLNDDPYTSA